MKRSNLKYLIFSLLLLFSLSDVSARGTSEENWQAVSGEENWSQQTDTSQLDPGRYNVIVRARDAAQNETIAGPYNILIDPDSDLPMARIIFPEAGRVIRSNLNIVGIAIDDDGVSSVEVRIDDQPYATAEGQEYWKYYVESADIPNGPHSITVRVTDDNGLVGMETTVNFLMDSTAPVVGITSHPSGFVVSGNMTFEGRATDANGIASVFLSRDNRLTYEQLRTNRNRETGEYTFSFSVQSRDMEDGPRIFWLNAVDETGTESLAPYLFFVDNRSPDITILYPVENTDVNGRVRVIGSLNDRMGVRRLWYNFNNIDTDIPLTPGNPYWSFDLDISAITSATIEFRINAEDTNGNTANLRYRLNNNRNLDKPVITVTSPVLEEGTVLPYDAVFYGFVTDDDGADVVILSGIGAEAREINARNGFSFSVAELPPGDNEIRLQARDINGTHGDLVRFEFRKTSSLPEVQLTTLRYRSGDEVPFAPSLTFDSLQQGSLLGIVRTPARLTALTFAFGEQTAVAARFTAGTTAGEFSFEVPVPANLPFEENTLAIVATDELGQTTRMETQVFFRDLRRIEGDPQFVIMDSRLRADGSIFIGNGSPVYGRIVGLTGGSPQERFNAITPSQETNVVRIESDGSVFRLVPGQDGRVQNLVLSVRTSDGVSISSQPLTIVVDTQAPTLQITSPTGNDNVDPSFTLQGRVTDAFALAAVQYSIDGGRTFTALQIQGTTSPFTFNQVVELGSQPQTAYGIIVTAEDAAGNITSAATGFNRQAQAPQPDPAADPNRRNDQPVVRILTPAASAVVSGAVTIIGVVQDLDGTASVQVQVDGADYRDAQTFNSRLNFQMFRIDLGLLAAGNHAVNVKCFDRQNMESRPVALAFTVSPRDPVIVPQNVAIEGAQTPVPFGQGFRASLTSRTIVMGVIQNAARLAAARYVIDEGAPQTITTRALPEDPNSAGFDITVPGGLAYGRHAITITAETRERRTVTFASVFFTVAAADPTTYGNQVQLRTAMLQGSSLNVTSRDPVYGRFFGRPIRSVVVQGSNAGLFTATAQGNQFTLTPATEGTAPDLVVRITTIDGLEYSSPAYNVRNDFADPAIVLNTPTEHSYAQNELNLTGRFTDSAGSGTVEYRFGPEASWVPLTLESDGSFNQTVSLASVPDGAVHLFLRGTDGMSRQSVVRTTFNKDNIAPAITFVSPPAADPINGLTSVFGYIADASPIGQLRYTLDGGANFIDLDLDLSPFFGIDVDFSELDSRDAVCTLAATDRAGNTTAIEPDVTVYFEADLPTVEIQIPENDALITTDFTISGMVFDDDGIDAITYRIDDGELQTLLGDNKFSVPIPLASMTDNEHTFECFATDIGGLDGETVSSTFRISLREPVVLLEAPTVDQTNRDIVTLSGRSNDENGVSEVRVSLDNGNSFTACTGLEEWTYDLDTSLYVDGTYSIQVVAVDNYGIEGQYFTLINIDNEAPVVDITSPADGTVYSSSMLLNGRFEDNVGVESLTAQLTPLDVENSPAPAEGATGSRSVQSIDLPIERILTHTIDLSGLPEGWYNLVVTVRDHADNVTIGARNILVQANVQSTSVGILYPQEGSTVTGEVVVQGLVESRTPIESVVLSLGDRVLDSAPVNENGYFQYTLASEQLAEGPIVLSAAAQTAEGTRVTSRPRSFRFEPLGPIVRVTSHATGDYVSERPWIEGNAEYRSDLDPTLRENREELQGQTLERVLVSIDNGRTFVEASLRGANTWRYRLETLDMTDGYLAMIVKAEFQNSNYALTRINLVIDKNPPEVALLTPSEGSVLNSMLTIQGTASDDRRLSSVQVNLRPGDKAGYSVPSFVQGMFVDIHFIGLTYWEIGLGLSFFDNNVKLQAFYGPGPEFNDDGSPVRFGGNYFGGKLLANIASIPFSWILGPDFEWLSMNITLGASFSYVHLYEPLNDGATPGVVLAAIIAQLEFPRVEIADWNFFNAFSFYTEPQLWFVPSEADPLIVFKLTFGARVGLF